jgi:hypothetical protein
MNVMISLVRTWPGTMIGKPGGYGITNFAETRSVLPGPIPHFFGARFEASKASR